MSWVFSLSSFSTPFIALTSSRLFYSNMCAVNPSNTSISSTRDQRIEAILVKIKGISWSPPHSTPSEPAIKSSLPRKYIIPSRRTPPPQVSGKYIVPSRRPSPEVAQTTTSSSSPEMSEVTTYSPITIIYSAATHQRSRSPPPKGLKPTFPCPPKIEIPRETKISFATNTNPPIDVSGEELFLSRLSEPVSG